MRVGVLIPAYQAAQTLVGVWRRLPAELALEVVLVVNDGSLDRTSVVAHELSRRDARLRVLDLPQNRGYGGAVKAGLRALRPLELDVIACVHADGQYAPEVLPALIRALQQRELDLLQGSRIASGTALSGGMPLYKYVAGRLLTAAENRVLGLRLTDYHSGYLLHGARAQRLALEALSDSFDFDLELLALARAHGLRLGEHPIPTHYGDERSHLNPLTYGLRVVRVMARYLARRYHGINPAARATAAPAEEVPPCAE